MWSRRHGQSRIARDFEAFKDSLTERSRVMLEQGWVLEETAELSSVACIDRCRRRNSTFCSSPPAASLMTKMLLRRGACETIANVQGWTASASISGCAA